MAGNNGSLLSLYDVNTEYKLTVVKSVIHMWFTFFVNTTGYLKILFYRRLYYQRYQALVEPKNEVWTRSHKTS